MTPKGPSGALVNACDGSSSCECHAKPWCWARGGWWNYSSALESMAARFPRLSLSQAAKLFHGGRTSLHGAGRMMASQAIGLPRVGILIDERRCSAWRMRKTCQTGISACDLSALVLRMHETSIEPRPPGTQQLERYHVCPVSCRYRDERFRGR